MRQKNVVLATLLLVVGRGVELTLRNGGLPEYELKERKKDRQKERTKERKKERKEGRKKERNITFLYIFFALLCRGWLFLGLKHIAKLPTMSEWKEVTLIKEIRKKEGRKQEILPSFM